MATYKVIQDIEAEDKLLGPLTLRQFIYAGIAAVCLYLCFLSVTKHAVFLLIVFVPIALFFGFFAFPFGRDQPTEVWALAKVRFMLKPHKRIWNQSGVKDLVTITAPKRTAEVYTNGLSQSEVQSRLKALAMTIDTRGWATKSQNLNMYQAPGPAVIGSGSDRLLSATNLPQNVPEIEVLASDDVLDEKNNKTASTFQQMIAQSTQDHHNQMVEEINKVASGDQTTQAAPKQSSSDFWFLNQSSAPKRPLPEGYTTFDSRVVTPGSIDDDQLDSATNSMSEAEEEKALTAALKARKDKSSDAYQDRMKVIEPLSETNGSEKNDKNLSGSPPVIPDSPQVTPTPDPAILALANNNDFNVATIERVANKQSGAEPPDDEVVVRLH